MIYSIGHVLKGEKLVKIPYTFLDKLENVMGHIEKNYLSSFRPLFIIKDVYANQLIKMELIGDQVIKSYILDLFDFEKEFLELV